MPAGVYGSVCVAAPRATAPRGVCSYVMQLSAAAHEQTASLGATAPRSWQRHTHSSAVRPASSRATPPSPAHARTCKRASLRSSIATLRRASTNARTSGMAKNAPAYACSAGSRPSTKPKPWRTRDSLAMGSASSELSTTTPMTLATPRASAPACWPGGGGGFDGPGAAAAAVSWGAGGLGSRGRPTDTQGASERAAEGQLRARGPAACLGPCPLMWRT